jgi:transposase
MQDQATFVPRWTLKRLVEWLRTTHQVVCCRETVRNTLKKLGFSWKKWRKLLNKAKPDQREAFVETLKPHLAAVTQGKEQLVYVDEAHIHLDTDEGYGWSIKGERAWISSSSPGLAKVSFYGVYFYNQGNVNIYPVAKGDSDNTVEILKKIRALCHSSIPLTLIWDNAPYHRSHTVKQAARELAIQIVPLPSYSPDFMPVEHLWQWLREDVTYHACYNTDTKLIEQVAAFEKTINAHPHAIADRLWTKTTLQPEQEKLRFSR